MLNFLGPCFRGELLRELLADPDGDKVIGEACPDAAAAFFNCCLYFHCSMGDI